MTSPTTKESASSTRLHHLFDGGSFIPALFMMFTCNFSNRRVFACVKQVVPRSEIVFCASVFSFAGG